MHPGHHRRDTRGEKGTGEGKKELAGLRVGFRENAQSWHELLVDIGKRRLAMAPAVKSGLQNIHHAETRADALPAFYDFPAEHRDHLRNANPIESVFATIRHRTVRTRRALSQKTVKLMVFKRVQAASKTWRRLNGRTRLPRTIEGIKVTNGVAEDDGAETSAA